jgi:hypothetical protein
MRCHLQEKDQRTGERVTEGERRERVSKGAVTRLSREKRSSFESKQTGGELLAFEREFANVAIRNLWSLKRKKKHVSEFSVL